MAEDLRSLRPVEIIRTGGGTQIIDRIAPLEIVRTGAGTQIISRAAPVEVIHDIGATQIVERTLQGPPGPIGPQGPGGAPGIRLPFAFGDATPATIGDVLAGKPVTAVELVILTPFDGLGSGLAVGDAGMPGRLMATGENDPATVGTYATHPGYAYGADTELSLTIAPGTGATRGAGLIIVYS